MFGSRPVVEYTDQPVTPLFVRHHLGKLGRGGSFQWQGGGIAATALCSRLLTHSLTPLHCLKNPFIAIVSGFFFTELHNVSGSRVFQGFPNGWENNFQVIPVILDLALALHWRVSEIGSRWGWGQQGSGSSNNVVLRQSQTLSISLDWSIWQHRHRCLDESTH